MITLKNEQILINIVPERGARIDDLIDQKTHKNWLWHPENYTPNDAQPVEVGTNFDAHWQGGWDDIFPSDSETTFDGRKLVDHGELWSQGWDISGDVSPYSVTLSLDCRTLPVKVSKTIEIDHHLPEVRVGYRFENTSRQEVEFMFKQHPAIAIEPGDEILMPSCKIKPVELDFSTFCGRSEWSDFPDVIDKSGSLATIHRIPPFNGTDREFVYASELAFGWCALLNAKTQTSLRFDFSLDDFPYVWLFQSCGGFNNHYVAMLEPATGMPWDIHEARQVNNTVRIPPRQDRAFHIRASLWPA